MSTPGQSSAAARRRRRRDRHGRGPRSPLLPAGLPAARTRSELFDQAVLEAAGEVEEKWPEQVTALEFAVDEVPATPTGTLPSPEVVLDGGVPLARFVPPGVDGAGRATKARVVVYRRPLVLRAEDADDLTELIAEVLTELLSAVLGEDNPESPE